MKPEDLHSRLDQNAPSKMLGELGPSFYWAPVLLGAQIVRPPVLLNLLNIQPLRGVIFTGEPGNGRHTTAHALISSKRNPNFPNPPHYLKITGWDLDCDQLQQAYELIDTVVQIARECGSLCLLLDSPEGSRHSMQVQYYLAELLQQESALSFLVVICEKTEMVNPGLLRMLKHCHCSRPMEAQREMWLTDALTEPALISIEGMEFADLVRETEGFSWKQMNDMLASFKLLLGKKYYFEIYKKNRDEDALQNAIKSGEITLSRHEAIALVESIRNQNPQPREPVLQFAPTASINTMTEKAKANSDQAGAFDIHAAQEFVNLHANPKDMSIDQLFNI